MAAGLQDGTVLVFGTGAAQSYGLVQSYSVNNTVETAEAKGADGHTVSIQQYDDKDELSLNYLELGTPIGSAVIGTLFTWDALSTWVVKSINSTNTVDGFKTVDITATKYNNIA